MAKPKKEEGNEELEPTDTIPVEVVNLDDEIAAQIAPPNSEAVRFWFGNGSCLLKFPDKTEFHVTTSSATVSDPQIIANLKQAAENPSNRIFIQ